MVEELKLAIKIDDATIEQSLLKQFANAQKMADKVVLDFKNVNFDDKQIEAKFKEMQKKAGQNPIDFSISSNTLDMLGQIDKRLTEIFSIGKGKSFIDSSSITADIDKIENKINELNKKYEEALKKSSSIDSSNISGKDVNLIDNADFQKLIQEVSELKNQFDDLKTHMQLLDDYTVPTDRFFELQSQVESTTARVSDLLKEISRLSSEVGATDGFAWELEDLKKKVSEVFEEINRSKKNLNDKNEVIDKNSLETIISLFSKMESSLSSIKGVLVDVGDGEELSPLLSEINNIQTAIVGLSSSLNNLHFNMNIDMGTDNQMEAKIQEKAAKALNAYEKLFNGLKMSGYGGEVVNNKFFDFDINKFDTTIGKVKAYKDIIERLRKEAREYYGGTDLLRTQTDDKLWRSASSAGGQLTQAINETTKSKTDNPLTELFGKTDLSGVIEQLNTIVSKLDEISVSAKGFTETFKNGLNVNASVEEIEKLTNRVKELETELAKIKTSTTVTAPQESNISSGSNPAIEQQNKLQEELKETQQQAEETKSALNDLSNIKGLKHYTDEVFDKFDNNMFGSGIGENRLGKAAYFFDEKNSSDWEAIGEYSKYLTTWSAEQVKIFDQTLGFTEEQINQIINEFYSDLDDDMKDDYKFDLQNIMDDDLYEFKSRFGVELQDVMKSLGYDAVKTNGGEYAFYNTDKLIREVQVYDQEAQKIIDINNKVEESIKETSSDQTKDAFPKTSENLEQVAQSEQKVQQEAVATDKALDNISFTPNTEGFEDIIVKFGILRKQAEQITKIVKTTKQTADGTPNISYKATLRNGSSYYLGENSTPQVLNASETVYDVKADNAKKLEREKQIWNELTTSLERYATIQKRIASNNALSTDNEEAIKLLEHIHELQRNDILPTEKLTASNEKLQQINQTVTDLKAKLKESTLDSLQGSIDKYQKIYDQRKTYSSDFTPSEQYTKNLTGLNTAIGNLVEYRNTLKNVSEVTVEQEAELKGLVTACEKASDSFKSLSASEKGASQIAIDKLVQRINKDLDECTNYSKEAKLGLRALRDELESANPRNLKEITSEIINIENAEIRAGRAGRSFFDTLKNSGFHQIAAQMAGMFGFYDVINVIKQAASTVTELNTQITELAKVSEQSSSQIYANFDSYADIAKEVRGTISDTIAATADWSKNGYSIPDAKKLAEVSQLYKNVGDGIDINTANESLISTLKGFQLEADQAEHIVDVFNEVDLLASYYSNVIALCIYMHIDSNYIG